MPKIIVIVGYGPGISTAVAEKFGAEGFSVALVARNAESLAEGVAELQAKGVTAAGFQGDAANPTSMSEAIGKARDALGPITVLHWNAISGSQAGDLMAIDATGVGGIFDVAIVGLLSAVHEVLPDLKSAAEGAVLVTNGAFGFNVPAMDALAVSLNAMGVALANAAKAKLVGLLSERLRADGVYVGEVTVAGAVKGTPYAADGGIEGAKIADQFWALYQARNEIRATVS